MQKEHSQRCAWLESGCSTKYGWIRNCRLSWDEVDGLCRYRVQLPESGLSTPHPHLHHLMKVLIDLAQCCIVDIIGLPALGNSSSPWKEGIKTNQLPLFHIKLCSKSWNGWHFIHLIFLSAKLKSFWCTWLLLLRVLPTQKDAGHLHDCRLQLLDNAYLDECTPNMLLFIITL